MTQWDYGGKLHEIDGQKRRESAFMEHHLRRIFDLYVRSDIVVFFSEWMVASFLYTMFMKFFLSNFLLDNDEYLKTLNLK